ncbi:hypothetical protein ACWCPD_08485 [Streptomyces sp. NPDC001935]
MNVGQLPEQVLEFARYLNGLVDRLDRSGGWCGVFWQRDPDGMRACLEGREVPPWDVVEALLQDVSGQYGERAAAQETARARALHAASLAAYDVRPGGRDALGDRLDVMLREQRYAAERQVELSGRLPAAASRGEAEAIRLDLAWAQDDHERATARCAELRHRMDNVDRHALRVRARHMPGYPAPDPRAGVWRPENRPDPSGGHLPGGHPSAGSRPGGGLTAGDPSGAGDAWRGREPGGARGAHSGAWQGPQAGAHGADGTSTVHAQGSGSGPDLGSGPGVGPGPGSDPGLGPGHGGGPGFGSGHGSGIGSGHGVGSGFGPGQGSGSGSGHGVGSGFGPGQGAGAGPGRGSGAGPGHGGGPGPGSGTGSAPGSGMVPGPGAGQGSAHSPGSAHSLGFVPGPAAGSDPGPRPAVAEQPESWAPSASHVHGGHAQPGSRRTGLAPDGDRSRPAERVAAPAPAHDRTSPDADPHAAKRSKRRRRGGARFAGMVDADVAPVAVPETGPALPEPPAQGGRTPRGARFAGAAEGPAHPHATAQPEPPDEGALRHTAETVATLTRLRGEGRSGEAHALLVEAAYWPPARFPLLAAELHGAGLDADWATLLWEAASLPADRLVAAADALTVAGRTADGRQMLRQGVTRPASEIGAAVLGLADQGRGRELGALLDAYVRVCAPEEAARSAEADPDRLVPLLLRAARGVSDECQWDLVHALRVAGFTA